MNGFIIVNDKTSLTESNIIRKDFLPKVIVLKSHNVKQSIQNIHFYHGTVIISRHIATEVAVIRYHREKNHDRINNKGHTLRLD